MGESRKDGLRVNFDRKLKLEFHGVKVTSDAGLLAYRELDEALGLTAMVEPQLIDIRKGKNTQHELIGLLRQSIYSRLGGYEDTNDAERLCVEGQPLVLDHSAGETGEDRSQSRESLRLCHLSNGRSSGTS